MIGWGADSAERGHWSFGAVRLLQMKSQELCGGFVLAPAELPAGSSCQRSCDDSHHQLRIYPGEVAHLTVLKESRAGAAKQASDCCRIASEGSVAPAAQRCMTHAGNVAPVSMPAWKACSLQHTSSPWALS